MELRKFVSDTTNNTDIKRVIVISHTYVEESESAGGHPVFRTVWSHPGNYTATLLIGLKQNRIRYKYPRNSGTAIYLEGASTDLLSLVALWICDLVPSSILADKIDDEFGISHQKVTKFLREHEQIKQEQELKRQQEALENL